MNGTVFFWPLISNNQSNLCDVYMAWCAFIGACNGARLGARGSMKSPQCLSQTIVKWLLHIHNPYPHPSSPCKCKTQNAEKKKKENELNPNHAKLTCLCRFPHIGLVRSLTRVRVGFCNCGRENQSDDDTCSYVGSPHQRLSRRGCSRQWRAFWLMLIGMSYAAPFAYFALILLSSRSCNLA